MQHLKCSGRTLFTKFSHNEGEVQGLFVMDVEMKTVYRADPEVLFMDAAYKLTWDRMALYILLAIDGNGESHLVAFFPVALATRVVLEDMMSAFTSRFSTGTISRTKVIVTKTVLSILLSGGIASTLPVPCDVILWLRSDNEDGDSS